MGKAARFACIFLPMLATLASLVCTLVIVLGGTNRSIKGLNSLYLIKLDTRHIATPESLDVVPGIGLDDKLTDTGLRGEMAEELDLQDFYASYLWNYCEGKIDGDNWKWEKCWKPKLSYAFDIEDIVTEETGEQNKIVFPDSVKKVQKAVTAVSKFMTACYILAFIATDVTFIVGWFGLLSRWGSCVTTIFANIAFLFLLVGSSCSAFLAYGLRTAFNKALDEFGVVAKVGNNFQATTWIGTAAALAACVFWLFSTCCCSGKTSKVMDKKGKKRGTKVERAPYTYERVASPYMSNSGNPQAAQPYQPYGSKPGFEPMRHH